jgi:hypothetical protein
MHHGGFVEDAGRVDECDAAPDSAGACSPHGFYRESVERDDLRSILADLAQHGRCQSCCNDCTRPEVILNGASLRA